MIVALLGPSADLERCERAVTAILHAGHTVAYDWPSAVRARREAGLTDADLSDEERWQTQNACLGAVLRCDVVWWLSSDSVGAAFEAGIAEGVGQRREMICSGTPHAIYRPGRHFATDAEALAWIVGSR